MCTVSMACTLTASVIVYHVAKSLEFAGIISREYVKFEDVLVGLGVQPKNIHKQNKYEPDTLYDKKC